MCVAAAVAEFQHFSSSTSHLEFFSNQFFGGISRGPIEAIRRPHYLFSNVPEGFNKLTAGSYSLKQSRRVGGQTKTEEVRAPEDE